MMNKPLNILISTAKEQDAWQQALAARLPEAHIHISPNAPACDYAVVWKPPEALFTQQLRLKAVFALGAGVDGLLAMPTLPRDLPLIRMEDVGMAAQMEEYALRVALREFRRIPDYERAQADRKWAPQPMRQRVDFNIGVLGLGVLGAAVAGALARFGFSVSGWSRTSTALPDVHCEHGTGGLDAVLARSELLIVLLPLTPETAGLIGHAQLAKLPHGAAVLNLARGELLDDSALLPALDTGSIGEAYLDVFQQEPLPPEHPYWQHPRVHITPHVAALTPYDIACHQVAEKIRQMEAGKSVSGRVDRQYGY